MKHVISGFAEFNDKFIENGYLKNSFLWKKTMKKCYKQDYIWIYFYSLSLLSDYK